MQNRTKQTVKYAKTSKIKMFHILIHPLNNLFFYEKTGILSRLLENSCKSIKNIFFILTNYL